MIVQKEILSKLRDFGLNSYESRLWTALLSRGVSTAGELSDISNVPRSRAYDVLESLEKKGFIMMKIGKPIKYLAVPPAEVVERVKKKVIAESESKSLVLDKLKGSPVLKELIALHDQGIDLVEPAELSGVIKGRQNLYNHLESMIKSAKESIVIMSSEEGVTRKFEALGEHLKKASSRGVRIKVAAPFSKKSPILSDLSKIADVKSIDSIKGRFVLVDGKGLVFMLFDDKSTHPSFDTGIWVNSSYFAKTLSDALHKVWAS